MAILPQDKVLPNALLVMMQTFKTLSPRRPYWRLAIASIVLHFVAFLLLLLVGLSLPIVKSVWFIAVRSETSNKIDGDISTELRFGIWGVCATRFVPPLLSSFAVDDNHGETMKHAQPGNITNKRVLWPAPRVASPA